MKFPRELIAALFFLFCTLSCNKAVPTFDAPLLKNIGDYSIKVTTSSPYAQTFFSQAVIMANGFNHGEAERSFRQTVKLDSTFAMGYWGIAYVLGPNLNSADNLGALQEIRDAVAKAVRYGENASGWEQALIKATQIKFPTDTSAVNAEGFIASMKEAHEKFPENSFVTTLYAEALMNAHAWDFFTRKGGEPKAWTPEIISLLEHAIAQDEKNPLANHLYLHATEAGKNFDNSLVSAERLKTLVPAAGHLVHMPSHIYINTGDYHAGSLANEQAVVADSIYIAEVRSQGYYPQMYYTHNYHFLAATAAFEGRAARSIEAAYKTASIVDKAYVHDKAFETVQHYLTIPSHVLVKFGQWEKIIAMPQPDTSLAYPTAIWHYARGMAYANMGKLQQAHEELAALNAQSQKPAIADQMIWGINKVSDICQISGKVLLAEIQSTEGKMNDALKLLGEAIEMEDKLNYNEPPDWFFSVRHVLGSKLLAAQKYSDAEKVYREDLERWPKNGFALNGLAGSLERQGKTDEATAAREQFKEAWKYADTVLKDSRVDPEKRTNVVLKIDKDSPNALVYISGAICMR